MPARDEADMLPVSLPSLLAQDYPGTAEIFLVDDCSKDGTGGLARELSVRCAGLPVTVVSPGEPEPGWTGKLWAVRHGIALARSRDPEYLLLTDADIAHEPAACGNWWRPPSRAASIWSRRWRGCGWRASGNGSSCRPSSTSSRSSIRSGG